MKKIKLVPVAPAAPAAPTINADAAINKAAQLWGDLLDHKRIFGEEHEATKLARARWRGAREVIDSLGVTDAYMDKCEEVENAK